MSKKSFHGTRIIKFNSQRGWNFSRLPLTFLQRNVSDVTQSLTEPAVRSSVLSKETCLALYGILRVTVIRLLAKDQLRKSVRDYTRSILLSKPISIWISNRTLSRISIFLLCVQGNWHVMKLSHVHAGYCLLLLQASKEGPHGYECT